MIPAHRQLLCPSMLTPLGYTGLVRTNTASHDCSKWRWSRRRRHRCQTGARGQMVDTTLAEGAAAPNGPQKTITRDEAVLGAARPPGTARDHRKARDRACVFVAGELSGTARPPQALHKPLTTSSSF